MNHLRSLKSSVPPVKSTFTSLKKLKARIRELAASNKLRLQSLFSDEVVNELARELGHDFRERVFDPATTLGLFGVRSIECALFRCNLLGCIGV